MRHLVVSALGAILLLASTAPAASADRGDSIAYSACWGKPWRSTTNQATRAGVDRICREKEKGEKLYHSKGWVDLPKACTNRLLPDGRPSNWYDCSGWTVFEDGHYCGLGVIVVLDEVHFEDWTKARTYLTAIKCAKR